MVTRLPSVLPANAGFRNARVTQATASAPTRPSSHAVRSTRRSRDRVSMAIPADGSYGIAEGVIYSYPVTCSNGRYSIVQGLAVDEFSRGKMDATHKELLEERDGVKDLL